MMFGATVAQLVVVLQDVQLQVHGVPEIIRKLTESTVPAGYTHARVRVCACVCIVRVNRQVLQTGRHTCVQAAE